LRFESRVTNMASTATGTTADADFSGMGIYVDGRVKNELDDLLRTKNVTELTARDVHLISSMHYLDDQPMLKAAEFFELEKRDGTDGDGGGGGGGENTASESDASSLHSKQPSSSPKTILDFGAGFAGDARCLASEFQDTCVTCVEVQRHIHDAAEAFTTMLGLKDTCFHQCVDVFEDDDGDGENIEDGAPRNKIKIKGAPFDALYSVLVILHVPKRDRLWSVLSANLKPGASIYIEDYFALAPLSDLDKKKLQEVVACPYLPSKETYVKTLVENGFENIEWETMTSKWVPFIETRLSQFRAPENTERNLRVHGAALTKELDVFYSTVHELFTNGSVGGVRIRAKKAKF
jgi:SAM-dependent methyltransferase